MLDSKHTSSSDDVIRSRLLHTLGIRKHPKIREGKVTSSNSSNMLSDEEPIQRKLNDSNEYIINNAHHIRSQSRERLVRFNSIVQERQIASHKRYTDRIKRTIWSDTKETRSNAKRNQIEYRSEGMSWENVLEDDDMYMDINTGEAVHPVWVEYRIM